jgi:DNA-binding MarR family transcriptional regulator
VNEGKSARAIAKLLGVSHTLVSRRIKDLELLEAPADRGQLSPAATHIERCRDARRGFRVPPHLEAEYFELLKKGLPITEACRQLGIEK